MTLTVADAYSELAADNISLAGAALGQILMTDIRTLTDRRSFVSRTGQRDSRGVTTTNSLIPNQATTNFS